MNKPSLKEVREHFKLADKVICLLTEETCSYTPDFSSGLHYWSDGVWADFDENGEENSVELWNTDEGFATIVKTKNNMKTLSRKDFKRIHDVACSTWKPKLLDWYGSKFALSKEIEVKDSEYKIMREACTKEQHILFDEIFGEDTVIDIELNKWYVKEWNDGDFDILLIDRERNGKFSVSQYYRKYQSGNWSMELGDEDFVEFNDSRYKFREATDEEIKEALNKKCIELGLIKGTKVECMSDNGGELILNEFWHVDSAGAIWFRGDSNNGIVFRNGEWTKVIKKSYPTFNKIDLPLNGKNIEVESNVMIVDGSYMVKKGKEKDQYSQQDDGTPIGHCEDVLVVKEINKPFPTRDGMTDSLRHENNCRIENTRTGEQWYCSRINIKNIESIF